MEAAQEAQTHKKSRKKNRSSTRVNKAPRAKSAGKTGLTERWRDRRLDRALAGKAPGERWQKRCLESADRKDDWRALAGKATGEHSLAGSDWIERWQERRPDRTLAGKPEQGARRTEQNIRRKAGRGQITSESLEPSHRDGRDGRGADDGNSKHRHARKVERKTRSITQHSAFVS